MFSFFFKGIFPLPKFRLFWIPGQIHQSGDYFVEAALLANEPRMATISAETPIEALKITRLGHYDTVEGK